MEHSETLENILERQVDKLSELTMATEFIKSKSAMRMELQNRREEVTFITDGIATMRQNLKRMKEENARCHELLLLLSALDKKIDHMDNNVPSKLIQDYKNAELVSSSESPYFNSQQVNVNVISQARWQAKTPNMCSQTNFETQNSVVKDCKRTLFSEPNVCLLISHIALNEFSEIPKYIIGRHSLDTLNSLIDKLNEVLKAKYTILRMGKAAARRKCLLNRYTRYKEQEISDDTGYLYFFTSEDYQSHTKTKLDKTKLNLMTALRHSKRVREYRTGNELRYVVISYN